MQIYIFKKVLCNTKYCNFLFRFRESVTLEGLTVDTNHCFRTVYIYQDCPRDYENNS
jgi:hypothetical protein